MHVFIEAGIRGGISTISHRLATANNPYLKSENYNDKEPHSYILDIDANNLYGWSMSQYLPKSDFTFLSESSIADLDFNNIADDSSTGYIVECDLEYPNDLHDEHSDYPLAVERMRVTKDMLSDFCLAFIENNNGVSTSTVRHVESEKLIPNLNNKVKYITHYRNLKLYLQLGLKLTKVHRVLAFTQEPWMKPYIKLNTKLRKRANSEFEKNLWKLMNNSAFGKTIENIRKRVHCKLVCDDVKAKRDRAKVTLKSFKIVNKDLILFECNPNKVKLNKPIYAGFTILDLSKVLMYDFHYNVIRQRYGDNVKLLFTDTDSFCYHIKTDDLYKDMLDFKHLLDTSSYPEEHPLFSKENCRKLGKMKDETNSIAPMQFVGLKSKLYSLLVREDEPRKMAAKGIKRSFVKTRVTHEMYLKTLQDKVITHARFRTFRSRNHVLQTVVNNKICLSAFDDKRYILNDGISSLAYGHYKIGLKRFQLRLTLPGE